MTPPSRDEGWHFCRTPACGQVALKFVDITGMGAGDLFGLAIRDDQGVYFVNDGNNTLDLLH